MVQWLEGEAWREQGYPAEGALGQHAEAAVLRSALQKALEAQGLLWFTSHEIPVPFPVKGPRQPGSPRE